MPLALGDLEAVLLPVPEGESEGVPLGLTEALSEPVGESEALGEGVALADGEVLALAATLEEGVTDKPDVGEALRVAVEVTVCFALTTYVEPLPDTMVVPGTTPVPSRSLPAASAVVGAPKVSVSVVPVMEPVMPETTVPARPL